MRTVVICVVARGILRRGAFSTASFGLSRLVVGGYYVNIAANYAWLWVAIDKINYLRFWHSPDLLRCHRLPRLQDDMVQREMRPLVFLSEPSDSL